MEKRLLALFHADSIKLPGEDAVDDFRRQQREPGNPGNIRHILALNKNAFPADVQELRAAGAVRR